MLKQNDIDKIKKSVEEIESLVKILDKALKDASELQNRLIRECSQDDELNYIVQREGRFFQDIRNRFLNWNLLTLVKRGLVDAEDLLYHEEYKKSRAASKSLTTTNSKILKAGKSLSRKSS